MDIDTRLEAVSEILKEANEDIIWSKKITVYGYQFNYETVIKPGISKYWFGENKVEEYIAPLDCESDNHNRPGTKKDSIEYIVIHDTASSKDTADEYAHAKYVINGGGGTSWHYSVGSRTSCHQIPDDEVAYHAGDSLEVKFELFNSGVKGVNEKCNIEIKDGYYYLDGKRSSIKIPLVTYELNKNGELVFSSDGIRQSKKAPNGATQGIAKLAITTNDINDQMIRIDLKEDGYYYMGPTYYNSIYKKIANRGGNLNSIGIETMVNQGSNLMRTWHRCAKLVAKLLIDNNLSIARVKPHHFFSGKPCPETLRENDLWDYFIDLVKIEYQIEKNYSDVKIELLCDNENVLEDGLFEQDKKLSNQVVNYKVCLSIGDKQRIIELKSKVI